MFSVMLCFPYWNFYVLINNCMMDLTAFQIHSSITKNKEMEDQARKQNYRDISTLYLYFRYEENLMLNLIYLIGPNKAGPHIF